SFAGNASSLFVSTPASTTSFGSTGQLPPGGGEVDSSPISVQAPYANAEVLASYATGYDREATSGAAVGDLVLLAGTANQITVDAATSKAVATCGGASGYSDGSNLRIGGNQIIITGQPNQVVSVPGVLTLTINEQLVRGDSIKVSALHLSTVDGTRVLVAQAYSGMTCRAPL